jgi:lipopolysaccharide export LptBFGC system permease protein LptF
LGAALAMIGLLAALLIVDIARYGIQALDLVGLLVVALFGFGIVGALRHPPPEE